jgi:hypothetical protein
MSRLERMALAGLCTGLGLGSCRPSTIIAAPAAIQVVLATDGNTIETFPQLLDGGLSFGSVPVLIPVRQTLTVTNVGSGQLNISHVTLSSNDPDGGPFSLVGTIPTAVGSSEPLTVQFDPAEQQSYSATLEIDSDDTTRQKVTIALNGTGSTEGLLCITPNPLDFGAVGQGQTETRSLDLSSCGTAVLEIDSIELGDGGDPAFAIVSSNSIPDAGLFLAPDASIPYFDLSFSPTASTPANASGTLIIQSSDPTHQPYILNLTGETVLAPIPIISGPLTCALGETITLDGGGSYDPNQPQLLPLTYQWSFQTKPLSSSAELSDLAAPQTMLTCDVVGNYVVDLNVTNDAGVESIAPAVWSIYGKPTDDLYVEMIWNVIPNNPVDMDLHLVIDGGVPGGVGDCNYYDPDAGFSCTPGSDHLDGPGPEWIGVAIPPATAYEVECTLYDAFNASTDSTLVTVRVYVYGVLAAQICQQMDTVGDVWSAATIAWPSGTVTPGGNSIPCPETN